MSDLKQTAAHRDIPDAGSSSAGIGVVGMVALVIAALYVGREVFVPVALAILLSFVLAPLIRLLQKVRVPRALAVIGVVLLAFAGITALATVMATQVTQLAGDLPRYQLTMREKVQSLRGSAAGSSALERAADVLQDLSKELDRPQADATRPINPLTPSASPTGEVKPDSSRGAPARPRSLADPQRIYHPTHSPARDDRHRDHLRDLHSAATGGSAEPPDPPCRFARPSEDHRSARRCRRDA
jgi:hypothetical protein